MENLLPDEFDLIVFGTGLTESVIAAAASRIGKNVLIIDNNNYYGGLWSSFTLDALQSLPSENSCNTKLKDKTEDNVKMLGKNAFNIKDLSYEWFLPEKKEEKLEETVAESTPELTSEQVTSLEEKIIPTDLVFQEDVLKLSRKFNIDLTPKVQYARGNLIELLISSNVARYSEYRNVSRVLTWLNGQLEIVPCSRSDVFANSKVSVIEKRMLMKLLTSLETPNEEEQNFENKSFHQFLKEKKLTANLIHYVLYAISMSSLETSCNEGIENTKRFLNSLGRFGKTPFLFSMYGSGEISQAFCRLSAVFGGICALNQNVHSLVTTEDNTFEGILVENQTIKAKHLVISAEKTGELFTEPPKKYISRAIFITDSSVMPSEKEHLTLLLYPLKNGQKLCTVIELGTLSGVCPKNFYIVHLISSQDLSPQEDFKELQNNLFNNKEMGKPNILWSCYFSMADSNEIEFQSDLVKNLLVCPGPDSNLDFDVAINKAKSLFEAMYPGEEFLPRAPDPEEIIFDYPEDKTGDSEENIHEVEVKEPNSQSKEQDDTDEVAT